MSSGHLSLDNTLGAAFIGSMLSSILYGFTSLQTFVFFKKQYNDPLSFKLIIYLLYIMDTLHTAAVAHCLYIYLITNFNNLFVLLAPNWSILASVYLTCLSDLIVRAIYARRVWKISGHSTIIITLIAVPSLVACGGGFAYATRGFQLKTFARITKISYLMYMSLGSAVAADLVIAGTICFHLMRSRTGCKRTDSIVNVLILYAVNSGLLTTVCAAACFVTYALWPDRFIFIGIFFCLSKLFLTNLLGMLNARDKLQARVQGRSQVASGISNMPSGARLGDFYPELRSTATTSYHGGKGIDEFSSSPHSPTGRESTLGYKPTIQHTAVMITYDRHVESEAVGLAC